MCADRKIGCWTVGLETPRKSYPLAGVRGGGAWRSAALIHGRWAEQTVVRGRKTACTAYSGARPNPTTSVTLGAARARIPHSFPNP